MSLYLVKREEKKPVKTIKSKKLSKVKRDKLKTLNTSYILKTDSNLTSSS